jgi:hypothetical protein
MPLSCESLLFGSTTRTIFTLKLLRLGTGIKVAIGKMKNNPFFSNGEFVLRAILERPYPSWIGTLVLTYHATCATLAL